MINGIIVLEEIGKHPLFAPITFILSIVLSIILGYYFLIKGNKKKIPLYSMKSRNLIRDYTSSIDKLQISYENKNVKSLTISRIMFWNNGNETIDGTDITKAEPIIIKAKEGINLLDIEIIATNESANQFRTEKKDGLIYILFDYIDKSQGIVLQILHTGISSNDISITGKIKGSKPIKEKQLYSIKIIEKLINILPFGEKLSKNFKSKEYKFKSDG